MTNNDIMEGKILTAVSLLEEVMKMMIVKKELPPKRTMSIKQFKVFIGNRSNAMLLAKKCNIGHSVFVGLINPAEPVRVMRETTKERILVGLNIEIVD